MHPRTNDDLKKILKMAMSGNRVRALASVIVSTAAGYAQVTCAEESNATLEEVVVSAQKQEQTLQSAPISIQVVSGEALQHKGVTSMLELSQTMPGVKITRGSSQNNLFIRGIGPGNNASLEQSVVRFVDDVFDGRGKGIESEMLDIERVEVLKGPQTTYFGNNAIGGAFNITTRKPTNDTDGYLRTFYTPREEGYQIEGAQNLPVSDTFRLRVAALRSGISRGWLKDTGSGTRYPKENNWAARLSALWDVTEKLTATFRIDSSDKDQQGGQLSQFVNCPPVGPAVLSPGLACTIAIANNQDFDLEDNTRSNTPGQMLSLRRNDYQATLTYDLGPATLTSVSAYTSYDFITRYDADGVAADLLAIHFAEDHDQVSQELRLASSGKNTIDYMLGLYYQNSDLAVDHTTNYPVRSASIAANPAYAALVPYLPLGQRALYSVDADTYSVFGVLTWNITDALSLSAGLRWTEVQKDFVQNGRIGTAQGPYETITPLPDSLAALGQAAFGSVNTNYDLSGTYKRTSPSVKLQYQITPDVMAYATYADGFKSGGFQGNNFSGVASRGTFDSETVSGYEVGIKSEWFGQLLVNVGAFRSDYSNLQVATLIPGTLTQLIGNAATARSQGVETEIQWAVTENWRTGINVTYLDAKYLDYPNAAATPWQRAVGVTSQDLSGKATANAPEFSGVWSIQYSHPISDNLELRVSGSVFYTDDIPDPTNDPALLIPSYEKYDASLTLANDLRHWEVSIVGKNLTDETVRTGCPGAPLALGSYYCGKEDPRMVSVQGRVHW